MDRMVVAAAALAALLLAPAAARADTLAFQRKGDVWLMQPDGDGAHAVTHGGGPYAWPSAADDGTIAAAGPAGRIYRFTPKGDAAGSTPTAATFATDDLPAEPPTHVRISPDGQKIAYDEVIDDEATTLWTPAGATSLDFPNQLYGQEQMLAPSWIGADRLLLSQDPTADAGADTFAIYTTGDGDDSSTGWFDDDAGSGMWATGLDAAAARAGTRVALVADDAALNDGTPTRVALRLFTAGAPGAPVTFRCELPLPADDSYAGASPSFSPDGGRVAWAQADGIHVATLGDLSSCGAIKQRTIGAPGDTQPYWTPADTAASGGGGGGGGSGGGSPGKLTLSVKVHATRKLLLGRGIAVRVTCSAACAPRAQLRLGARTAHRAGTRRIAGRTAKKLAAAGTTTLRVKLRPSVARGLRKLPAFWIHLRVSAPGAAPVRRAIRG